MNTSLIGCLVFVIVVITTTNAARKLEKEEQFSSWKGENAKNYESEIEKELRHELWLKTEREIQAHNNNRKIQQGETRWTMAHNKFSDMTLAEKQAFLGADPKEAAASGRALDVNVKQAKTKKRRTTSPRPTKTRKTTTARPTKTRRTKTPRTTTLRPTTTRRSTTTTTTTTTEPIVETTAEPFNNTSAGIDWREIPGMIQPVKNQGACGSCWAFAGIAALEAAVFMKTGKSVSLSEQQLVDCTYRSSGRDGCQGGWMYTAYDYLKTSIGSITQSAYPYVSGSTATWGSSCRTDTLGSSAVGYTPVTGYVYTPDQTEAWLENAVATVGPVPMAFIVVNSLWSYSSGIYYDADCTWSSANYAGFHAVVVVGFGTDPTLGGDYWIVRNSWGTGWGDKGYIKFARNRGNLCELASYAQYPTL